MRIAFALLSALLAVGALHCRASSSAKVEPVRWPSLPAPSFPIRLSENKRYLVDDRGMPFLIRGDAAWSLIAQLTREEVEVYLEDRKQRGFNLLEVNLIEHHFADAAPRNAIGEAPFTVPGDFTRPNEAYFAHVDWVLRRAAAKGFAVLLCPAYLGYEGNAEGWYQDITKNGVDAIASYGRFIGTRYREFPNIIWLEGGDFTPPLDSVRYVDALALAIKRADPNHLHAAHWGPETSAVDVPTAGWLDINTTYTYLPVYLRGSIDDGRDDGKPHFLLESAYEDEHGSTARSLRGQVYDALLTGATGEIFGQRLVWKFKKRPWWAQMLGHTWSHALDTPGTRGVERARALFVTRRWFDLVSDEHGRILIDGRGMKGSDDYAVAASTADGRLLIVYSPSHRSLAIDTSRLVLPARARWYDPTNGALTDASSNIIDAPQVLRLSTPDHNHGGETDWVLVVEAQ